MKSVFIKT